MSVVKSSGVITKFPILIDVELDNIDFSVAPSGIYSANANNYVGNNPIFRSDNAAIFSDAFTFDIMQALPVGTDLATLKAGNRRIPQRKYVYDIVQVYGNNHYMKLHFKKINGTTTEIENMIAEGAETSVITVEEYPNNPNHNVAFAARIRDTRHNLTGIALYVGFAVQWRADNFSYNLAQPSYIFIQETLEANGDQFLYVDDFDYDDEDFGDESTPDGYGQGDTKPDFDHHSDVITVPDDPTVSTGSVGFMNVYKVSEGALSGLGQYLFPDIFDPATLTDIVAVLRAIAGIFAYQDSIQYVVDLHAVPCVPTLGNSKYIKLGALETDISQPTCASDYVNIDCGSVSIPERFQNFLDYIGVTCKIFIPFVGFVDIAPEYWVGGSIGLKYKFNIIDGSFMAYLISTSSKSRLANSVIGQYSGNACLHLPVVAASYGAIVGGLVKGAEVMVGAPQAKNGGQIADVADGALTACNFQPKMSQSNAYSGSAAFLGGRRPYLLIEYTVQSFSKLYNRESGLPLNVAVSLGSVSGFTVVENPHLSLTCDADEKEEIESLLKTGVIF